MEEKNKTSASGQNDSNHSMEENDIPESNAARRIRLTEDPSKERNEESSEIKKAGFFENFWYHHKWAFIITTSFMLIAVITISQILNKKDVDLHIAYAGPVPYDGSAMASSLEAFNSIPYGGKSNFNADVIRFYYFSPDKIEKMKKEAEERGDKYSFDPQFNTQEHNSFRDEIVGGESIICIIDRALYEEVANQNAFLSLAEIYGGDVPENIFNIAVGECGVSFTSTNFAKFYTVFSAFPEDTVIAVRKNSVIGGGKRIDEEEFNNHIEYFKALVSFEYPEGYLTGDN